jgi:homoserine kinase type II
MAVYTELTEVDAARIAAAHDLGVLREITPIAAGSVNSNYFVETDRGRWFVRIYEEQESDGVAYEWRLLAHLQSRRLPVPERVAGPAPGALRVEGKPTAVFAVVRGTESCQAAVTRERAAAVGAFLGRVHLATDDFAERRAGRFTKADVRARLDEAEAHRRPELTGSIDGVRSALDEVDAHLPADLPSGVIHGDLFRDNVRFDDSAIVAAMDWESASDGTRVYDLAVTLLAWCFGDDLDLGLAATMCRAYDEKRPLAEVERASLRLSLMAAAARFTATRITDYYLRGDRGGSRVMKDYRRFSARLDRVRAFDAATLAVELLGGA